MEVRKGWHGFSAFSLKLIAIISMAIDHIGVGVFRPYSDAHLDTMGYDRMVLFDNLYDASRIIGRFAFPIFAFLLVESFFHTRNRWKFFLRTLIFAFISEIPFDLVSSREMFCFDDQNVFITLSIALLCLIFIDKVRNHPFDPNLSALLIALISAAGCVSARLIKSDYDYFGILIILGLYFLRPMFETSRISYSLITAAFYIQEWYNRPSRVTASLSFIPIYFYNGEKGRSMKYFFYLFYPVHLLIIYFIGQAVI